MDKNSSNARFVADRITRLRIEHGISEYQLSLDLGFSKGYIQAISSGNIIPSLGALYKICDYFEMTPLQFFDSEAVNPQLLHHAMEGMRKLSEDDLIMLIGFINRLQSKK